MPKPERLLATAVLSGALLLSACGGGGGSEAATTVPAPPSTEPAPNECHVGLPSMATVLTSGLKPEAAGGVNRVNSVRTSLLPHTYYVTAELTAIGGERALWVSTADDGSGPVYSVNAVALKYSKWSDANDATAGYSATDPAAVAAMTCP